MGEKVRELLKWGVGRLDGAGLAESRIDAEALLAHSLVVSREHLISYPDLRAEGAAAARFKGFIERRALGEPVAYITGVKEFWSLEFEVDRSVLIPRPETEFVVEEALAIVRSLPARPVNILDIGTGSGNIAVSLAKELDDCCIHAIDVCEEALALAGRNAAKHGVASKVSFRKADLLDLAGKYEAFFDIVVSNPPYIALADIEKLPPSVSEYEPMVALEGGESGLFFIRGIFRAALDVLKPGRFLVIEIGFGQKEAVQDCVADFGAYAILKIAKDYAGIERVLVARLKN